MEVGSVVQLRKETGGVSDASVGVCYLVDRSKDRIRFLIMFSRGRTVAFGPMSAQTLLDEIGFSPELCHYKFVDRAKLNDDYNQGVFDPIFGEAINGI